MHKGWAQAKAVSKRKEHPTRILIPLPDVLRYAVSALKNKQREKI
jgi:hypothetical protein